MVPFICIFNVQNRIEEQTKQGFEKQNLTENRHQRNHKSYPQYKNLRFIDFFQYYHFDRVVNILARQKYSASNFVGHLSYGLKISCLFEVLDFCWKGFLDPVH